ncbi:MAG: SiaB family protein kinase [Bacteroidia bacterium]|nr:SiaB family protein kinase [Bacteroidia bacterium]
MAFIPENLTEKELLFYLFKQFEPYTLTYVYKGIFNPALTDRILSLAETNMNLMGEVSKVQKKVYFVMVESLQNITRHQDLGQEADNQAFFVVQNKSGKYGMASGNVVENEQIAGLQEKIEKINALNGEDLKAYYKNILENTGLSEKGGAGLGLIEIARRSGNKLSYKFAPFNQKQSFFYFKSKVSAEEPEQEANNNLSGVKELHDFTKKFHINMVYQGVFTHDNLKSLLSMTEGSVASSLLSLKRKAVNVMIEMLQNICNHGASINKDVQGIPGILLVATINEGLQMMTGNFIGKSTVDTLKAKLNKINDSNLQELEDIYSEIIMKDHQEGQKGAGLGFIDIRIKSSSKINYSIVDYNENFSFLSVSVLIPY